MMFKHKLTKHALAFGVVMASVGFPLNAQARPLGNPASGERSLEAALPTSGSQLSTQSGFQWGDAGVGAGAAILLVSSGIGASATIRRRRVRRAVIG